MCLFFLEGGIVLIGPRRAGLGCGAQCGYWGTSPGGQCCGSQEQPWKVVSGPSCKRQQQLSCEDIHTWQ